MNLGMASLCFVYKGKNLYLLELSVTIQISICYIRDAYSGAITTAFTAAVLMHLSIPSFSQHITRVLYPTLSCLPHITNSLRLIPHQPQKLASRPTVGAKPFCAFPELSALKFSCSIIIQWSAAPLCYLSCRSPGEEDQPGPLHKDTYNKVPLCGGRVRHCQCVHTSSMRRSVLLHLHTEKECSVLPYSLSLDRALISFTVPPASMLGNQLPMNGLPLVSDAG